MKEITIATTAYRIGELSAMQQFHVTRRLAPILAATGIAAAQLREGVAIDLAQLGPAILGPAASVMAAMSNEDLDYVIHTTLSVVKRVQVFDGKEAMSPVTNGQTLQFADIDMLAMIRLVVEVLKGHLAGFFAGLDAVAS